MRRKLAEERGLPAYCILHDSALRQIARECPASESDLALVSGVGEKRAKDFGAKFLAEIAAHPHPEKASSTAREGERPREP